VFSASIYYRTSPCCLLQRSSALKRHLTRHPRSCPGVAWPFLVAILLLVFGRFARRIMILGERMSEILVRCPVIVGDL
jgi:hypothetical protein